MQHSALPHKAILEKGVHGTEGNTCATLKANQHNSISPICLQGTGYRAKTNAPNAIGYHCDYVNLGPSLSYCSSIVAVTDTDP